MPFRKNTALAAALALFHALPATAHMMMGQPVPYGKSSLDNSPLVAPGTDFPCKQRSGVYDDEGARAKNKLAAGAQNTMSFVGSAVHGGGSCQISLTKDKKPTKDTEWAVIDSIEGGCPGTDGGPTTFKYSIPSTVAPGDYTLAWTWFNKIGNREMYMNCAPITVTGSSKKRDVNTTEYESANDSVFGKRDASFPAMFVANIGNGCKTADSTDLQFPDPGSVVQKAGSGTLTPPTGTCPGKKQVSLGGGGGSGASSKPSTGNSSTPASKSTGASPSAAAPGTATILASVAPSAAAGSAAPASPPAGGSAAAGSAAPASPSAAGSAAGEAPSAAPASPSTPASGGSSSGSASAGSASPSGGAAAAGSSSGSGGLVCSADGKQFGLSGGAGSTVMQPVAAGTKCENGAITFAKAKRNSAKFGRKVNIGGWS